MRLRRWSAFNHASIRTLSRMIRGDKWDAETSKLPDVDTLERKKRPSREATKEMEETAAGRGPPYALRENAAPRRCSTWLTEPWHTARIVSPRFEELGVPFTRRGMSRPFVAPSFKTRGAHERPRGRRSTSEARMALRDQIGARRPRGSLLSGSSRINGLLHRRSHHDDAVDRREGRAVGESPFQQ